MNRSRTNLRRFADGVLIACVALGSFYATAHAALTPRDPQSGIAVIFAPWTSERDVFLRAVERGARFVRFGGVPFIAVVIPEVPDYATLVRRDGAWMVADPQLLAACLDALTVSGNRQ